MTREFWLKSPSEEMPHRDFNDRYTGGMTYANAVAFRILGTNLLTLRIVLFALFMFRVPTVFAVAREYSRPVARCNHHYHWRGCKPMDLLGKEIWLGGLDSNQDSQIQNLKSCQLDDLPIC